MEIEYNKAQLRAVNHVYGPMMVLAGPGSGKTAVITGRLKNLILKAGIPAGNILVVTFSKKAAEQMRRRFEKAFARAGEKPVFGTFHSIFYSIIRNSGSSMRTGVISEQKKYNFIRSALESSGIDFNNSPDFFSSIISEISKVKGNVLDINGYTPKCLPKEIFVLIYRKYTDYLRANSLLDFDDMLLVCLRMLASDPEILRKWQDRYRFILIDEFQDINPVQYEIMKLLAKDHQNIFIVGDDDQSIYGFRGADPKLMKRFLKDFRGAKQVFLDINYRSSPEITAAAGRIISQNSDRFPKNIRPFKEKSAGKVRVSGFKDAAAEAEQIIKEIRRLKDGGLAFSDIAVLFRNNADMEYISGRLESAGIEFSGKQRKDNFYNHFIVRDITAYIRASCAYPDCRLSDILLIMNRPSRYISRDSLSYALPPFASMKLHYAENRRMAAVIGKFEADLKTLRTLTPFAAVKYIRKAAGYDFYLKENAKENGTDIKKYEEILKRLEYEARNVSTLAAWAGYVEKRQAEAAARGKRGFENPGREDARGKTAVSGLPDKAGPPGEMPDYGRPADAVNIMTIHASKGLEWEAVFIPLCNDSIIPGKNDDTFSALEEERRILYVAVTRAKKYLYISYAEKLHDKRMIPSRFIKQLNQPEDMQGDN